MVMKSVKCNKHITGMPYPRAGVTSTARQSRRQNRQVRGVCIKYVFYIDNLCRKLILQAYSTSSGLDATRSNIEDHDDRRQHLSAVSRQKTTQDATTISMMPTIRTTIPPHLVILVNYQLILVARNGI